ncbi:villin 4 [Striga asiatica]|uniref:Villin 4 n=1 Tax=Striga asiatica TaxID=4170 RepID=A0A5A7PZX7_STRAF|nr:villin 4 [Striga asiatica]
MFIIPGLEKGRWNRVSHGKIVGRKEAKRSSVKSLFEAKRSEEKIWERKRMSSNLRSNAKNGRRSSRKGRKLGLGNQGETRGRASSINRWVVGFQKSHVRNVYLPSPALAPISLRMSTLNSWWRMGY